MSSWIWKFGDMEKYHSLLVHTRRQNYGYMEPPVWKVYRPEAVVRFRKKITSDGGTIRVRALGTFTASLMPVSAPYPMEQKLWGAESIEIPAGDWILIIRVMNLETFPAIYVDGDLESDCSWEADDGTGDWQPAGASALFTDPEHTPDVFPFRYEEILPVSRTDQAQGFLIDYGRETFAGVTISGADGPLFVSFGESKEEALDTEWSVIHETRETDKNGRITYPACAFRYIYVVTDRAESLAVTATAEIPELESRASFVSNEDVINRVWKTAEYTFLLNAREFFLDGIKRDRWVWSADAYQSLFVNHYLYMDPETEKRTLTALGGGLPVEQYINTIMDYSYFWIIAIWDYYVTYGDRLFLEQIYPQAKAHMEFCAGRRSEDGLIRGQAGDWVFIDWAEMDREGALLGEQVLLAKALESFGRIAEIVTGENSDWIVQAKTLREKIQKLYYDEKRGVFIDSYESGKKNVTRHNNLLAYLFLDISEEQKKNIYHHVVLNDEVPAITTPYFKFYENQVLCEEGDGTKLEESLRSYYGSMLALGATTLYEQYDPTQTGTEHYAMYGRPYEKSLCHAWSCSPIYLIGAYRMGVKNTGIRYDSFEVRPKLGDMESFQGTVPLPDGEVHVAMNQHEVRVMATVPGGTLYVGENRYTLEAGKVCVVKR